MTVSSVAASNGVWFPQPLVPGKPQPAPDPADSLGLSANELSANNQREQLQSGGTLSSLAPQQRVTSSALLRGLEADLEATAPKDEPVQLGGGLTEIAAGVAGGTPSASQSPMLGSAASTRPDQDAIFLSGPTSIRAESNLATLAKTLGTDSATLLAQLGSAGNLSALLSASGDAGYGAPNLAANAGGILVDQYA